jgi:lipopolysaccharide biosynthesis glycosyltransferase
MFVTLCTKDYLIGFEVLLKSLIDNNPRVIEENIPFIIISNEITEDDLVVSKKIYKNIQIKNFDETKYTRLNELKKEAMAFGDYFKYEIFSMIGCEKVIFLDSDTLVLGNIDYLLDFKESFGAVRDLYIDQFNTGVMIIGKKYLNEGITKDLITLTDFIGITEHLDQDIINKYFIDDIIEIPLSYNFLKIYHKPIFRNSTLAKHIKILHYVVKKPWQEKQLVPLEEGTFWLERYWLEYYAKIMKLKLPEII